MEKRSDEVIRDYFESASQEEREELVDVLLEHESKVSETPDLPDSVVRASRIASVILIAAFAWIAPDGKAGWVLVGALPLLPPLWLPNHLGWVTGRLWVSRTGTRSVPPWLILTAGWVALLARFLRLWSRWSAH